MTRTADAGSWCSTWSTGSPSSWPTGRRCWPLEDLHWSDDADPRGARPTRPTSADLPMLVVGTYRSDELYPSVPMREWRARLLGSRLAEEARLRRLTLDEVARDDHAAARRADARAADLVDAAARAQRRDPAARRGTGRRDRRRRRASPIRCAMPDTLRDAILQRGPCCPSSRSSRWRSRCRSGEASASSGRGRCEAGRSDDVASRRRGTRRPVVRRTDRLRAGTTSGTR